LLCNNVLDNTYYDHNIVPYRLSIQVATTTKNANNTRKLTGDYNELVVVGLVLVDIVIVPKKKEKRASCGNGS